MRPLSKQELRGKVLAGLRGYDRMTDEDIYREIDRVILEAGHSSYGTLFEKKNSGSSCFTPYGDLMYWRNICGMIQ